MKPCDSKYLKPYINKIMNNEVEHCKEQRQMMDNIVLPVLARDDVYLDEKKIADGLDLQKYFSYKLIEWEIFLFALIAGLHFANGENFFTCIRIYVGRGSGKNGFISFLCFYFISPVHGIRGYNVDLLANSEKQAQTSFNDVYEVVKEPIDKSLKQALKTNFYATKELITGIVTKSELRFNTSSKRGKDSKRTGCIIYDEKHEYIDGTNMNTLRSGLGKVPHPREITISTDGHIRDAVFDKEKEQNREILKQYNPANRTLVFWCRIEKEEEWNKMDKLIKAIPSLDDFPTLRTTIQQEIIDMPYTPDYFPEYMAKRCNYPIGDKETNVTEWKNLEAATDQASDIPNLKGSHCIGAVDYAKTNDFVSCGLLFKRNGKFILLQHTFVCAKSRDLTGIKAPLDEWAADGQIEYIYDVEITPDIVVGWFAEKMKTYYIKEIAIDSFRYSLLNSAFKRIGFDAYERKNIRLVRPSDIMKAAPVIESAFNNQNIIFEHKIMRWFTWNVKRVMDNKGNISYQKIDPALRKTDGFMMFVNTMTRESELTDYSNITIPDLGVIL